MMDIFKRECDMKIEELTKERDQLKARVAELEGVLRVIKEPEDTATWLLWDHALNRTSRQPAQSLAAIEARVLREAAEKFKAMDEWNEGAKDLIPGWLNGEADRIEQEGGI